jgi:hypothetical protein
MRSAAACCLLPHVAAQGQIDPSLTRRTESPEDRSPQRVAVAADRAAERACCVLLVVLLHLLPQLLRTAAWVSAGALHQATCCWKAYVRALS